MLISISTHSQNNILEEISIQFFSQVLERFHWQERSPFEQSEILPSTKIIGKKSVDWMGKLLLTNILNFHYCSNFLGKYFPS